MRVVKTETKKNKHKNMCKQEIITGQNTNNRKFLTDMLAKNYIKSNLAKR
jgi:hypothetical protein